MILRPMTPLPCGEQTQEHTERDLEPADPVGRLRSAGSVGSMRQCKRQPAGDQHAAEPADQKHGPVYSRPRRCEYQDHGDDRHWREGHTRPQREHLSDRLPIRRSCHDLWAASMHACKPDEV
jgi:hypothetical protein